MAKSLKDLAIVPSRDSKFETREKSPSALEKRADVGQSTRDILVPEPKQSIGEVLSEQQKLFTEILNQLSLMYNQELSDSKTSDEELRTLSETLLRVDAEKRTILSKNRFSTPQELYSWSIANANIIFPYATLSAAVKNIRHSLTTPRTWGSQANGTFRLPPRESLFEDSQHWVLIKEILSANFGEENVFMNASMDETVPPLSNSMVAKNPAIETVLIRLLELAKSPLSATLRSRDLEKAETNIKNMVDFIVLDTIYQREESYHSLTLSGLALSQGRRAVKVESRAGNKLVLGSVYAGYRLADLLCTYLPRKTAKTPESEAFVHFILDIIRGIIPEDLGDYQIPKGFFETPSVQLRSALREGPQIKTKKGLRHNLYVPLSFVKSSECVLYPETHKKDIIDVGSGVLKHLDKVNSLPVKEAAQKLSFFKRYISRSYTISDTCRGEWRRNGVVPSPASLKRILVEEFPNLEESSETALQDYISKLERESRQLIFSPARENAEEMATLMAAINSVKDQRQAQRTQRVR
jgi:hypothetical protein